MTAAAGALRLGLRENLAQFSLLVAVVVLGMRGTLRQWLRLAVRGPSALRSRTHLGFWYDRHRDK